MYFFIGKYFKFLNYCFRIDSKFFSIYIILGIFSIFTPYLYINVFSNIFDSLMKNLSNNIFDRNIVLYFILLVLLTVYMWFFETVESKVKDLFELSVDSKVVINQLEKLSKLKQDSFEDKEVYDLINRVCGEDRKFIALTFVSIIGLFVIICQSMIYFYFISKISFILACVLVLIVMPIFYLSNKFGKVNYEFNKSFTYIFRKNKFLYNIFIEKSFAKEKEIFNFGEFYKQKWNLQDNIIRKKYNIINLKWFASIKFSNIITEIITFIIIFSVLFNFSSNNVTIGFVVAFISSISKFINSISWGVPYYLKDISEGMEYFVESMLFFNLDEENYEKNDSLYNLEKIEFKNVNFKYPNGEACVLKDVSFTFERSKHYAIVGLNGSGKSTIVKLILGIYSNFSGNILLNGQSISKFNYDSLRKNIVVLNQDFKKYNLSFKDNIILGEQFDEKKFNSIISKLELGSLINKLKDGIETNLGNFEIGASDLSGGEWHKIAFARILYRDSPFYIFDEPISSYDSISEKEFVDKVNKYFKDKMCLIISHRFSIIKDCDYIYVIQDGEILQSGTHSDLKSVDGIYRKMFESQKGLFYE